MPDSQIPDASAEPNPADATAPGEPAAAPSRRSRVLWIAGGAVVVVAVVAALIAMGLGTGDKETASTGAPASSGASESPTESNNPSDPATDPVTDAPTDGSTDPGEAFGQPAVAPVPIGETSEPATGISASLSDLEAVQGDATSPGDIAGPSVRFTMTVTNSTASALDLSLAIVNAYYGADQSPAAELPGPGASKLPDSLAPGDSATGVFVFNTPVDGRDRFVVTLDIAVGTPLAVFQGSAPK